MSKTIKAKCVIEHCSKAAETSCELDHAAEPHGHCEICFQPFPIRTGPGRPRAYCSDECRQVEKLMVWLATLVGGQSMIDKWGETPEGMALALAARGRLWSTACLLNPVAKGYRNTNATASAAGTKETP